MVSVIGWRLRRALALWESDSNLGGTVPASINIARSSLTLALLLAACGAQQTPTIGSHQQADTITTVTTDQSTYPALSSVIVTYSGMSGATLDWIAIADAGSADTSIETYAFTGGALSGTAVFHNLGPGTYVAR